MTQVTNSFERRSVSEPQTTTPVAETGTARVKRGMAEMLKGGVIMDVVTADQAKITPPLSISAMPRFTRAVPVSATRVVV